MLFPVLYYGIVRHSPGKATRQEWYSVPVKYLADGECPGWLQDVAVPHSVTIDWTVRENARVNIQVIVKRILRKYGYPPDKQKRRLPYWSRPRCCAGRWRRDRPRAPAIVAQGIQRNALTLELPVVQDTRRCE